MILDGIPQQNRGNLTNRIVDRYRALLRSWSRNNSILSILLYNFFLQKISISLINSKLFIIDFIFYFIMNTDTTFVKLENDTGNGNIHFYPYVENPTPITYAARGAGTVPDPILVEPLEEPVRDIFKAIDEESRMLDWLHSNRHMRAIVTYNQQRTVRTTTYTNVRIVSHERLSVTAGFEIVID